ncbi:MAG: PQQ-dependent sugar dehydrogenase [Microbacteriaceae bacterium]|nr:PQQ-dependent sugar dehydrogenase [Microbacteriaceae bacterium]
MTPRRNAIAAPIRRAASAAALIAALVLAGCTADPAPPPPTEPGSSPATTTAAPPAGTAEQSGPNGPLDRTDVEVLATGLDAPWSIAFAGNPLISQRDDARILELLPDGTTRPIGTVPDVVHGGEGGLLGIALDFDGRLYAYSTGPDGNRVQRFELTGEPGAYGLGDPETIIDGIPAASTHNGGRIAIRPDGHLYIATGDAGQPQLAQDPSSLAGKILRVTLDGDVPDDNPIAGSPVWSLGHRNVQGLAWTRNGTMYASEFGASTWDELNIIEPGGNYGWPEVEGAGGDERFIDPVQQWATADASPSGIAIVPSNELVIANLRGQVVRVVRLGDPTTSEEWFAGEFGRIRDAVTAPDGSVWLLTNNTDGRGSPSADDDRIIRIGYEH